MKQDQLLAGLNYLRQNLDLIDLDSAKAFDSIILYVATKDLNCLETCFFLLYES